jgi:hypothetical protein
MTVVSEMMTLVIMACVSTLLTCIVLASANIVLLGVMLAPLLHPMLLKNTFVDCTIQCDCVTMCQRLFKTHFRGGAESGLHYLECKSDVYCPNMPMWQKTAMRIDNKESTKESICLTAHDQVALAYGKAYIVPLYFDTNQVILCTWFMVLYVVLVGVVCIIAAAATIAVCDALQDRIEKWLQQQRAERMYAQMHRET